MSKKITPEKPPTKREASIALKALRTGKTNKPETRTLGGRILSETAVAAKAKKK